MLIHVIRVGRSVGPWVASHRLPAGPYGRQHDLADPGRSQHFRHCLPDTWQRWDGVVLEWFILWNSNSGKCQCLGKITHEYLNKDVSARPKRG